MQSLQQVLNFGYLTASEANRQRFLKLVASAQQRKSTNLLTTAVLIRSVGDFIGSFREIYIKSPKFSFIAIDYLSFCKSASKDVFIGLVRDLIVGYPEVYFLFDDSEKDDVFPIREFLSFPEDVKVDLSRHLFSTSCPDFLENLPLRGTNLFDGSNLRYSQIRCRDAESKLHRSFARSQDSRARHLAITVDVDVQQGFLTSYALYANGYRVRPISSQAELSDANDHAEQLRPEIIMRDFDLQFADQDLEYGVSLLRDWELVGEEFSLIETQEVDSLEDSDIEMPHSLWNKLKKIKEPFFVSSFADTDFDKFHGKRFPLSGIYADLHENISEVKRRFQDSRDIVKVDFTREKSDHSHSLDVYYGAREMLSRAQGFFSGGDYIHCAVVCRAALEELNGFHATLLLKIFVLLSEAENAIAMSILGGDEKQLATDARFRAFHIKKDVERLEPNRRLRLNILNQIFSDCRNFCRQSEHYLSEEAFISELAYLNDGLWRV